MLNMLADPLKMPCEIFISSVPKSAEAAQLSLEIGWNENQLCRTIQQGTRQNVPAVPVFFH